MKQFEIKTPKEGVNTIVAQFTALKLDEVVEAVKAAEDPQLFVQKLYPDLAEGLVDKILTLARGETPADDFAEDDATIDERDETTLAVDLGGEDGYVAGDLVYLRGRRWVVGSREDDAFVLKAF